MKRELIPEITGDIRPRRKERNTLVDDNVAPGDPGSSVSTEPAAPGARVSQEGLEVATETPKSIMRGKDDFVPTPGQTALHPSQVNELNLSFPPVMAEEAAAFAEKMTRIESERLVATPSMDEKPSIVVVEDLKRNRMPIPYQTSPYSSQRHEPYIPTMAEEAVAFAMKKAIDSEMFVVSSPHPTRDDFVLGMASEAVAFGKEKAIESDIFKVNRQSTQEAFNPHVASEGAIFGTKEAVGPGLFADDKLATPIRSEANPMVVFTASTSIRGKDDFMPTPGQTALHPSQTYKFFVPEMAAEAHAFLNKKGIRALTPRAVRPMTKR